MSHSYLRIVDSLIDCWLAVDWPSVWLRDFMSGGVNKHRDSVRREGTMGTGGCLVQAISLVSVSASFDFIREFY